MNGLAHAKLDETLGEAARAYSKITKEAANYMEVQARKSSLQVLGSLQLELFAQNRSILKGKRDIHLGGNALGRVTVFRSESEIAKYLQNDPMNGADTIWVLKSGLNMPNIASFAGIILEDPIMKASHYDGYARSKKPTIPLLQIPDAAELYAKYHGKNVILEVSTSPSEDIVLAEVDSADLPKKTSATERIRLDSATAALQIFEIDGAKSNEEIGSIRVSQRELRPFQGRDGSPATR
jgi:hypothetical protein